MSCEKLLHFKYKNLIYKFYFNIETQYFIAGNILNVCKICKNLLN